MKVPLERWTDAAHPAAFLAACAAEHVRGARIVSALRVLGPEQGEFYLRDGMAMYVEDGILLVAAPPEAELAPELLPPGLREIHGPEHLCRTLHARLGGTLDSSFFMKYIGGPLCAVDPDVVPADPETVFAILRGSHPYYREHLRYAPWLAMLTAQLRAGQTEAWQLRADGFWAGTGALRFRDDECCVLGEIAVLPEFRHRGLGSRITRYLTARSLALGRTPRLMAGYDAVAGMYQRLGFEPAGRWGELFLC